MRRRHGIEQRVDGHRRRVHVTGPSAGGTRARHDVHSARLGVARTRAPPGRRSPCGLILTVSHKGPRPRMFDSLSDRLRKTLAGLTGRGRVTEADVDAAMREVRLALLEADVNFKVVKEFVARVRERAIGAEILESLTAGQQVVKIVNEELTALLSAGDRTFRLVGQPGRGRARRPPGLRQDDLGREARQARRQARPRRRCSLPPTRTGRPPRTSSRRSARASTSPSIARPSGPPPSTSPGRASRTRSASVATS